MNPDAQLHNPADEQAKDALPKPLQPQLTHVLPGEVEGEEGEEGKVDEEDCCKNSVAEH